MSITPYETLAVAPKSQEASIFRTNQLQKETMQQAQIVNNVQQQAEQKLNRTTKMEQKDETPFQYDAKEKGNNAYYKKQQKEKKKKEEQEQENRKKLLGCSFEITV